jgi:hypothetical protein
VKKPDGFYILKQHDSGYDVLKVSANPDGSIKEESKYHLLKGSSGYMCDCPGFLHRKECKHALMPFKDRTGKVISLDAARAVVRGLLTEFKAAFKEVCLAEEPYERDESGGVKKITIELAGCVNIDTKLSPGVWEGTLKDSGVLVRMVIK